MTEQIATSNSGGQKGRKPEAYSLIPVEFLAEVARVYNYGATKYSAENWRQGYPWSWSYDALGRHLAAFWSGQEIDPESGRHHLAHAAFHLASLYTYSENSRYLEHDDRPHVDAPVIAEKKSLQPGDHRRLFEKGKLIDVWLWSKAEESDGWFVVDDRCRELKRVVRERDLLNA